MDGAGERATRTRFVVLAFLCAMCVILYLDRICMGQALPAIRSELGLDDRQMALVLAAFTLAYGLFEVPVGGWADRYGARRVLPRIVLGWSFFTALTGVCNAFWSLLAVRFLFGAGEAGAYPTTARVATAWFPASERGRYRSLFLGCANLGAVAAPALASELIERVGWRWTFVAFGSLGAVWASAFWLWFRDTPAEHPRTNDAERELIGPPTPSARHDEPFPWTLILRSRNILLLSLVITCSSFFTYLFFSWYPSYLREALGATQLESGRWTSLVQAGSMFGVLFGGWMADRLTSPRLRQVYCATTTLLGAGAFLLAMRGDTAQAMSIGFCASSFCVLTMHPIWWSFAAQVGGRHLSGVFGFMNAAGTVGAMASQLFFGWFADWRKELGYVGREAVDPAFAIYVAVLVVAGVGWLSLDVRSLRGEQVK